MPKLFVRTLLILLVVAFGYLLRDGGIESTNANRTDRGPAAPAAAEREASPSSRHPLSSAVETLREAQQLKASSRADNAPLWTSTRTLTAKQNAEAHWQKHRREFPEYRSAEEYIEGAHQFLRGPPKGTQFKERENGDRLLYHPASNTFAVQARSGAPRTMFRPNNGQRYWSRQ